MQGNSRLQAGDRTAGIGMNLGGCGGHEGQIENVGKCDREAGDVATGIDWGVQIENKGLLKPPRQIESRGIMRR